MNGNGYYPQYDTSVLKHPQGDVVDMRHTDIHRNNTSSEWWIVGVIFLVFIILAVLWWLRSDSSATTTLVNPTTTGSWTYVTATTTTNTFSAGNFMAYSAVAGGPMTLQILTPSSNPTGQQFLIDNSAGSSAITLSGVTVATATGQTVPSRKVQYYVWKSAGTISLISI